MAPIQPFEHRPPFKRTKKENLKKLIRQLESCIAIAGIADAYRHRYLHLHVRLTFFDRVEMHKTTITRMTSACNFRNLSLVP